MNRILKFFFFSFGKKWCFNAKKKHRVLFCCVIFFRNHVMLSSQEREREREDSCFKNKNNEKQAKMKWPNVWLVGWLVVIIIITSEDGQWRKRRIMFVCLFVCLSICQFLSEKKKHKNIHTVVSLLFSLFICLAVWHFVIYHIWRERENEWKS